MVKKYPRNSMQVLIMTNSVQTSLVSVPELVRTAIRQYYESVADGSQMTRLRPANVTLLLAAVDDYDGWPSRSGKTTVTDELHRLMVAAGYETKFRRRSEYEKPN